MSNRPPKDWSVIWPLSLPSTRWENGLSPLQGRVGRRLYQERKKGNGSGVCPELRPVLDMQLGQAGPQPTLFCLLGHLGLDAITCVAYSEELCGT